MRFTTNDLVFFDSNILVYADDSSTPAKQQIAANLLDYHFSRRSIVLSLQVMQEYFSVITRKAKFPVEEARRKVEILSTCAVVRFEGSDIIRRH